MNRFKLLTMKHFFFLTGMFFFSFSGIQAQVEKNPETIKAINEQVWLPFMKAYADHNIDLYLSIHSEDILRVTPWGIQQGEAWFSKTRERWASIKEPNRIIDFRFEHRIHADSIGYEVGYYKLVGVGKDGRSNAYFGRFHVKLLKQNDQWRIAQDWDSSNINGREVTATDFDRLPNWQD